MSTEILINSFGGRLDINHCKGEVGEYLIIVEKFLKDLLNDWKERGPFNQKLLKRDVSIVFLDTDKKALFVALDGSKYQICIGSGLCILILDLFLFLMSCPKFMPHIGSCDVEEHKSCPDIDYFSNCRVMSFSPSEDIYDSGFFSVPNDEDRVRNAFSMCYDVLEYLIYHEFSHILRGHLRITKEALGHSEIIEHSVIPNDEDEKKVLKNLSALEVWQFLELDADRMAAELMFNMLLSEEGDISKEQEHELNRRSLSIAIYMMIHGTNSSISNYRRSRYPHPSVRFRILISWLYSSMPHNKTIDELDILFNEFTENLSVSRNIFQEYPFVDSIEASMVDEEEKRLKSWYFSVLDVSKKFFENTSDVWRKDHFDISKFN
jgi:hypothetical protein